MSRSPVIALITDFGLRDPFVGIMKGVVLGICPTAAVVDITHDVGPGDIAGASFALAMSFQYFPKGSVFLAVVDPGVGTERRAVAVRMDQRAVVCPDNGLLSWLLRRWGVDEAVALDRPEYFLSHISSTFHGRDIFAPVAAHIANGTPLADLGSPAGELVTLPLSVPTVSDRAIQGEVIYVDRFGNLLTNITREDFNIWRKKAPGDRVSVNLGSIEIRHVSETYGSVPHGQTVAVFGSSGVLEVAINGRSAAGSLGAAVGSHVLVYHIEG